MIPDWIRWETEVADGPAKIQRISFTPQRSFSFAVRETFCLSRAEHNAGDNVTRTYDRKLMNCRQLKKKTAWTQAIFNNYAVCVFV